MAIMGRLLNLATIGYWSNPPQRGGLPSVQHIVLLELDSANLLLTRFPRECHGGPWLGAAYTTMQIVLATIRQDMKHVVFECLTVTSS